MKSAIPRITLLGSNSGNNLGDAAILSGILDAVSKELPTAEFLVPSTNPNFTDKHYGERYNVKGINVMPWTGSIRLFGLPTMIAMAKSDCALICDGIIFGKKFLNPTFNFLITLVFLVPWAKLVNCKLVCYSCGIGPFPTSLSEKAARFVINACDLVIMRENDSAALARKIGVDKEIEVTGDAAFINPVNDSSRAEELANIEKLDWQKNWFGINVTKYIDGWLAQDKKVADKDNFLNILADAVQGTRDTVGDNFYPVLFCTHPMDLAFCRALAQKLNTSVVHNNTYLSHDIQALMAKCELFMGMRFHSVVLASAVEAPVIGLIYAPKVRGFMRLLDCEEYGLELSELSSEKLQSVLVKAWNERSVLQAKQKVEIDALKAGARQAAKTLATRYFANAQKSTKPEDARVLAANA